MTPGANVAVQVGAGPADNPSKSSSFGTLTVEGGKHGGYHNSSFNDPNAKGGNGGSGGGAGYTWSDDGGGIGSGISMQGLAGAGGEPCDGPGQAGWTGQGFGAGGGCFAPKNNFGNDCGGTGGSNGSNGATVGNCGGGGGGAGGLLIPGFDNPPSVQDGQGVSGVVWIEF